MGSEEPYCLMENAAGNGVHHQAAAHLLKSCGGQPLALVIIGLHFSEVLDKGRVRGWADITAFLEALTDPVYKLRMRIPVNAELLNRDRKRH